MTSDEAREYVVRRGWAEHRPAWWSHPDRPDPAETSLSGAVEFERRRDAGRVVPAPRRAGDIGGTPVKIESADVSPGRLAAEINAEGHADIRVLVAGPLAGPRGNMTVVVDRVRAEDVRDVVDSIVARRAGRSERLGEEWAEFARTFPDEARSVRSWADRMAAHVDVVHARIRPGGAGPPDVELTLRRGTRYRATCWAAHELKMSRDPIGTIHFALEAMLAHLMRDEECRP